MALLVSRGGKPAVLAVLAAFMIAWWPGTASGHVGNRLRLGYRSEPILAAAAHLTELYLEAVSGFQVDLREYPDPFALQKAIREEQVDVAVEFPAEAWERTTCPSGGALVENMFPLMKTYYQEHYGAVWVCLFRFRKEGDACLAPSVVITKAIAGDLAYYTLPDYLKKLAAAITQEEVDGILRRDPTGSDRSVLQTFLARKKLI